MNGFPFDLRHLNGRHLGLVDPGASQELGPVIGMVVYDLDDEGVALPSVCLNLEEQAVTVIKFCPVDAMLGEFLHLGGAKVVFFEEADQFLILTSHSRYVKIVIFENLQCLYAS